MNKFMIKYGLTVVMSWVTICGLGGIALMATGYKLAGVVVLLAILLALPLIRDWHE